MRKLDEVDLSDFLDDDAAPPAEAVPDRDLATDDASFSRGPLPPEDGSGRDDYELKTRIAGYYINKQLEESILRHGNIPEHPAEATIGVGFIDIADYSYISNWLSPKENQVFLNGLYSAFHHVLKKRGGYLNKISGDSMMFHFGGVIDPLTKDLPAGEAEPMIARLLFLTCMEVQESCRLFNRADEDFIPKDAEPAARRSIAQAFMIIRNLRENLSMMTGIDAMFQVRIRIGAAIGEVCIGNFGPEGARQWDVIGVPVIEARRMESTAPVDGVRLGSGLFEMLRRTGLVEQYLEYFRGRASGFYQGITRDELFSAREVVLKDKRNACFESCAVQANPDLPEDVWRQVESYLASGESGLGTIMDIIRYYRGNRLVVGAIEELFRERSIRVRKAAAFKLLAPVNYRRLLEARGGSAEATDADIESRVSLYRIFSILGAYQDHVKRCVDAGSDETSFADHDQWVSGRLMTFTADHQSARKRDERSRYFERVLMPATFAYVEAALREHLAGSSGS